MRIVNRLTKYLENKDLSLSAFEKKIGVSHYYLANASKNKQGLSEAAINKVIAACPDLNPVWLLLGEGEMLKSGEGSAKASQTATVRFSAVRDTLKGLGKEVSTDFENIEKVDIETIYSFCDAHNVNGDYILSGIGSVFRE